MDDGRQSSGATSLTGILAEGERWFGCGVLEGELRFKEARRAKARAMAEGERGSSQETRRYL